MPIKELSRAGTVKEEVVCISGSGVGALVTRQGRIINLRVVSDAIVLEFIFVYLGREGGGCRGSGRGQAGPDIGADDAKKEEASAYSPLLHWGLLC
jgi:hypothetical protein